MGHGNLGNAYFLSVTEHLNNLSILNALLVQTVISQSSLSQFPFVSLPKLLFITHSS